MSKNIAPLWQIFGNYYSIPYIPYLIRLRSNNQFKHFVIIENSLKYAPHGSEIIIRFKEEQEKLIIRFEFSKVLLIFSNSMEHTSLHNNHYRDKKFTTTHYIWDKYSILIRLEISL
jgi:hypothetical protein